MEPMKAKFSGAGDKMWWEVRGWLLLPCRFPSFTLTQNNSGTPKRRLWQHQKICFLGTAISRGGAVSLLNPGQSSSWGSRTGGSKLDEVGKLLCGPIAGILWGTRNLPGHIEVGDSPLR